MYRNRRRRRGFVARAGVLIVVLAAVAGGWLGGLFWFVEAIPRDQPVIGTPADIERTDAIVVLTGGSRRLATGLELLEHGYAGRLFVSGVYGGVEMRELLSAWSKAPDRLADSVVLGYAADNTIGNALETATWMREQGYRSLRLVTANYHMKRALLEFRLAMPEVRVMPHPVVPDTVRLDGWWLWRGTASLLAAEYTKYLVVRLRYWLETTFDTPDGGPDR
jgi:uncharacterized SAM-binding protein YcdF (DUF218 family)